MSFRSCAPEPCPTGVGAEVSGRRIGVPARYVPRVLVQCQSRHALARQKLLGNRGEGVSIGCLRQLEGDENQFRGETFENAPCSNLCGRSNLRSQRQSGGSKIRRIGDVRPAWIRAKTLNSGGDIRPNLIRREGADRVETTATGIGPLLERVAVEQSNPVDRTVQSVTARRLPTRAVIASIAVASKGSILREPSRTARRPCAS